MIVMQSRWVKLLSDGVMPDRVDQRVAGRLLRGIMTSLLINSEPIKLAIYSLPLVAITATSIYLYVGAVARQLAAEAVSFSSQAPDLAFLLAIESSRLRDDVDPTSALIQVLQYNPALEKFTWGPTKDIQTVAYDHLGKTLAVGDRAGCNCIGADHQPGRPPPRRLLPAR